MLVGVPWLVFFVVRTLPQVGHVSLYSVDDWLAYQVAGYRIYMNGFWLEGGNRRLRLSAALSLDHRRRCISCSAIRASARVYWDAACLLAGWTAWRSRSSRPVGGFRCGRRRGRGNARDLHRSAPIWYFVGRGLSEIAAAGFAFSAALVDRARGLAGRRFAAVAGVLAVLMFYARLNQLMFARVSRRAAGCRSDVPARMATLARASAASRPAPGDVYAATFAAGRRAVRWRARGGTPASSACSTARA